LKYRLLHIIFAITTIILVNIDASAKSVAFGFFINESRNESLDYLEKILPNSFAGALKAKYNFDIFKPAQIPVLASGEDDGLKKEIIKEGDLKVITKDIDADYFVYGSFKPLDDNKIKMTINVFEIGTTSVFQFEDIGYLETEIFKLIDKIAVQIKNIANKSMIYKKGTIPSKSKLAILTNIDGEDLNSLYYEFLHYGYKLSPTQGNDIYGLMDYKQINKFYHFSGVNASFHMIDDRKDVELWHGTWSGTAYYKKISEEKKAYEKFSFNYMNTKNEIIKKIRSFSADDIDYIIIIGFNKSKNNAWIRCLNLKNNKLLITESEIEGSSINKIANKIIKSMTTGLPENI